MTRLVGTGLRACESPWALCITPGPNRVLYSSDAYPGRIYKLRLDGKVLGYLGESGKQLKQLGWIHEIACPSENELYVAELLNWRCRYVDMIPIAAILAARRRHGLLVSGREIGARSVGQASVQVL
jgi:hypothetical protein